jgi:hypothetical protein
LVKQLHVVLQNHEYTINKYSSIEH